MKDLGREFFERDLSEAEEESLAREIADSPEAALRFAGHARASYEALGLKLPRLPKAPGSALPLGPLVLAGAFLALLGTAGWVVWSLRGAQGVDSVPQATMQAEPSAPAPLEEPRSSPAPPAYVTPVAANDRDAYEALDILVKTAAPGTVHVAVRDGAGVLVRNLYAGPLPQGLWRFRWDGKLDGNGTAAPGNYRVEIRSGGKEQSRTIRLSAQ